MMNISLVTLVCLVTRLPMHASFLFHHSNLQLAYTTQAWILKFKNLCHASKHMKCTFKYTIQVYELAPPTCVLKILIDPLPLSYLSPCVNFSICPHLLSFHYLCTLFLFSYVNFHYFSSYHLYLCFSLPLSSMTTKAQNVDRLRLSMSINGVRIIFPKYGSI